MQPIDAGLFERIVALRRDLHRHPELSMREERTSAKVRDFLGELGVACRSGVGGFGVVADYPGRDSRAGSIAFRADMDALPIREETGLPFASENEGVMHACAHDGHTSILAGLGSLLAREDSLPVPVRLIFQPAEETGDGALKMLGDGVLDGVSMIFGGHVDPSQPLGTIIVNDGPINASADEFEIRITGKGGHGARPQDAVDAVVVGSLLVTAIQTIVSREIDPVHPSVVTVGMFEAGSAANVIADKARLVGTIRAQDEDVRRLLHDSLRRICGALGPLHRARVELEIRMGSPAIINSPEMAELCRQAAAAVVGPGQVRKLKSASMGGEDFGRFLRERPGCYVRFGATAEGGQAHPAHTGRFDFDERVIGIGAAYYRELVKAASARLLQSAAQDA